MQWYLRPAGRIVRSWLLPKGFSHGRSGTVTLPSSLSPSAPLTDPSIVWEFLAKTATHNKSNASGSPAAGRRRTTAWLAVAAARTTYLLLPSFSPLPCGIRRGPFCKYDGETGSLHDRARSISDAFPAHLRVLVRWPKLKGKSGSDFNYQTRKRAPPNALLPLLPLDNRRENKWQ